ncbi:hypothetical protein [uncultured Croceitalea sp.]|uniref:hypothetical protein n=1 Tax=uncultured Croceitalea sp. TaxID=1798908 RepID=UPI003306488A
MKPTTISFLLLTLFTLSSLHSQETAQKNETDLFTTTERDSLQLWFYDRATVMGLKDNQRDEFYNIVLYHTFKMKALEKKEKGYSPEEIRTKFEALLKKQNTEVRAMLTEKQYAYYLETYDKMLKDVYKRKNWK